MNFALDPNLIEQDGNNITNNNTFMNPITMKLLGFFGGMAAIGLIVMLVPNNCNMINPNNTCITNIVFGGLFIISIMLIIAVLSVRYFHYYVYSETNLENNNQQNNHDETNDQILLNNDQIPLNNNITDEYL